MTTRAIWERPNTAACKIICQVQPTMSTSCAHPPSVHTLTSRKSLRENDSMLDVQGPASSKIILMCVAWRQVRVYCLRDTSWRLTSCSKQHIQKEKKRKGKKLTKTCIQKFCKLIPPHSKCHCHNTGKSGTISAGFFGQ